MKDAAVADKVRDIIQPPIEAAGYELVDVHWKHEPGGWVLRVFVDGVGGISSMVCSLPSSSAPDAAADQCASTIESTQRDGSVEGGNAPLATARLAMRVAARRSGPELQDKPRLP